MRDYVWVLFFFPAGPAVEQSGGDDGRSCHPPPVHWGEASCIDTQLSRSCLVGFSYRVQLEDCRLTS